MITIQTLFAQINIDQNKEYIIHHEDYPCDKQGHPLPEDSEEVKSGKFYRHGDNIIIETERKKYIITAVYDAYEWTSKLINHIASQKDTDNIFVDMFELWELRDGSFMEFECGRILVETV